MLVDAEPTIHEQGARRRSMRACHSVADGTITGAAAYDALVAVTTTAHGAELATCDRHALRVYETYGLRMRVLA